MLRKPDNLTCYRQPLRAALQVVTLATYHRVPAIYPYRRYVDFDASGHPARIASRAQASLAQFCDGWMRNIADQQRLVLS